MNVKSIILSATLCLCGISAAAQDYAAPALRSPVVAIEYTGQRCRYCPTSMRNLLERQKEHGEENYIICAMHHLESYSLLPGNNVSLFNAEALVYAESTKIHAGVPQLSYNSLGEYLTDNTLDEMFLEPDLLECTGSVILNEDRTYDISIKTRLRSDQTETIGNKRIDLMLWSLENDIVAIQDDNGVWTYPAHKHIFRGSVNGTWGVPYEIGSEYKAVLPLPEAVSVPENTEVVAFFVDSDSKVILDACYFKIKTGPAGIEDVEAAPADDADAPMFNVLGQQIRNPHPGQIYIQNGKKHIAK